MRILFLVLEENDGKTIYRAEQRIDLELALRRSWISRDGFIYKSLLYLEKALDAEKKKDKKS